MLPSLAAANPLAYTRRPISQICSLILCSLIMASPDDELIQDAGAVGVHRLVGRVERGCRLAALAETDAVAVAGPEAVEDHKVLAVGRQVLAQGLQAVRHADDPAAAGQAGVC